MDSAHPAGLGGQQRAEQRAKLGEVDRAVAVDVELVEDPLGIWEGVGLCLALRLLVSPPDPVINKSLALRPAWPRTQNTDASETVAL